LIADVAVIGLGTMGAALARNLRSRGLTVAVTNRSPALTQALIGSHGAEGFVPCPPEEIAGVLRRPRIAIVLITAGKPVDWAIDTFVPRFDAGDVLVDGGNSHFADTERRVEATAPTGVRFVGLGVSGGEEGALKGPSLMPGGDRAAWTVLEPVLTRIAAVSESGPCVTWCGSGGAGHATKMVHNGIEYGDMQLVGEVWTLLRDGLGLGPAAQAEVFRQWNAGRLESFLIELAAEIVAARDPHGDGPLVERILDEAGQKGTGRWTAVEALTRGVPLPTITSAVDARAVSSRRSLRRTASDLYTGGRGPTPGITVSDLEQALYAAKLASYAQGFDLLETLSDEQGYGVVLSEVARVWTAGCIIRARFLGRVCDAFARDPELPSLVLDPTFAGEIHSALPAWRRVVAAAVQAGIAVPALSASLAWLDQIRTPRGGAAALIQAQRDRFGAHTYRIASDPDTPIHTDWAILQPLKADG
jgi:6-phosphogluconate dehydrogenase